VESPPRLRKRREERGNCRIVAKSLTDVREAVNTTWAENETAAQLKWILPQLDLPVPCGAGPLARFRVIGPKKMQQVGVAKFRHLIGLPLFVDQQRKSDARLLAKQPRIVAVAQSNGRQRRSLVPEGVLVFAQLRDVLAAKNSSIVTQKNDHGGLAGPQRSQPRFLVVGIR